ncbi:Uncharacterized inner membrane transporter yiJE [Serratia fonticola]|uniref:Uncharacterized inner membrane transporter yiJE n=1 Tax=Serratia fonticola TaxID=47917 RepID=A0A4V6KVT0_SERFO|nr:Uncharacterized inner membrane transporter yiJE [Serratia fonticola]
MDTEGKYLTGSPSVSSYAPDSVKIKGVLLLVGAIVIWGANWPVMKAGLSHMTPIWLSTTRFVSGALCLFALQILTKKLRFPPRKDWPLVASVGLLQMLTFTVLGAFAMTEVPAGRSAILAYTTPLWVMPIAVLFFRQSLSRRQLMGSLLGGVGVIVLFNPFTFNWGDKALIVANLMLLTASFAWAMCILHLRYHKGVCSAYELAPWQMLLASVPLALMARVFRRAIYRRWFYIVNRNTAVYGAAGDRVLLCCGECRQHVVVEHQHVDGDARGAGDRLTDVRCLPGGAIDSHAGYWPAGHYVGYFYCDGKAIGKRH